jgi:hypothetical protein
MKRYVFVAFLVVASVALVLAANAHFLQGPTLSTNNTSLTVSGTLAGLGNQDVTIRLNAAATVSCTNKGGNPPPGQTENISATSAHFIPRTAISVSGSPPPQAIPVPMDETGGVLLERHDHRDPGRTCGLD